MAAKQLEPADELIRLRGHIGELVGGGGLDLPLLPENAARILAHCDAPDSDASSLAAMLHEDPALAGHVLRLANSALYSASTQIRSLQQAVSRLGRRTLQEIITTIALRSRVFGATRHAEAVRQLWRHSIATAGFARGIARGLNRHTEGAFLWGLMHDCGRVVLLGLLDSPDIASAHDHELTGESIEWLLDELHCSVGAALAETWGLDESLRDAIMWHHEPVCAENSTGAFIVRLADDFAHQLTPTDGRKAPDEAAVAEILAHTIAEHPAVEALTLYPDQVEAIVNMREAVAQQIDAAAN